MRRELERVVIPDEHEVRERAWRIVETAFAERRPVERRPSWRPLLVLAAAVAVLAAAFSPAGRAVLDEVRDAVLPTRVERAVPTATLPAPGRLLVVSAERGGVWVLRSDGSRRRLGAFEDATWSPFGKYVVATTRDRLVALEPDGSERWSLVRRRPSWPRWGGSRSDTRIAYVAGSELRIVAGDGTGDRALARRVTAPPAWRPGAGHVLVYAQPDALRVVDVETRRELWRRPRVEPASSLVWSSDGRRLAVLSQVAVTIYDGRGRMVRRVAFAGPSHTGPAAFPVSGSFVPRGHDLALVVRREEPDRRSQVVILPGERTGPSRELFAGAGVIGDVAWSPDGRWLLADWRSADQWVFLRMPRVDRVRAVSGIAEQFARADGATPMLLLEGRWCCSP